MTTKKKVNRIDKILMERDGISEAEAKELRRKCHEALENGESDAVQYYLGLEDDYIFDILY